MNVGKSAISQEVLVRVGPALSIAELCAIKRTCRTFYQWVTSDRSFVERLTTLKWQFLILTSPILKQDALLQKIVFSAAFKMYMIREKQIPIFDTERPAPLKNLFAICFFRDDADVVKAAAIADPLTLRNASSRLKNSKSFILDLIAENPATLWHAPPCHRADEEIVLATSSLDPSAIWCASQRIQVQKAAQI